MHINATSFKNHLGKYMEYSIKEPVIVEKSGRPSAVLISFDEFAKLSQYEDFYWSTHASQAETLGYLGAEETHIRLKEYAKRAGISTEGDDETIRHHEKG